MRRTPILAVALAATSALALSACGGGGGFSSSSATQNTKKGPVKLTVMIGSSGDAETKAVKDATAAWASKTGNTVEVIAASDLGQQLGQAFASSTPPDLFYTDASKIGTYAKAGNLYAYGDQCQPRHTACVLIRWPVGTRGWRSPAGGRAHSRNSLASARCSSRSSQSGTRTRPGRGRSVWRGASSTMPSPS